MRRVLLGSGGGVATLIAADSRSRDTVSTYARAVPRTLTAASAVIATAADYKLSMITTTAGTSSRHSAVQRCHERGAERIAQACNANRGVYIKLGQIAQLSHIFPEQYVTRLRSMLDDAPGSSFRSVKRTIEEDLGQSAESLFELDRTPVSSASLAQVHRAVCKRSGDRVAVKVQHRGLQELADSDVAAISSLVYLASYFGVDYSFLVDEIKQNLPNELSFTHEADNCKACGAYFRSLGGNLSQQVAVPSVYESLTSSRVLTMEYIEGFSPSDTDALRSHGISYSETARLVSSAFAKLIFECGWLHSDPHQANLFIRPTIVNGVKKPQLVIIDHGLYRNAQPYRDAWAQLWLSLLSSDVAGIESACKQLGAQDYKLFTSMVTTRSWERFTSASSHTERIRRVRGAVSEEERQEAQRLASEKAGQIQDLLAHLPRPLLLVLKTSDNLRCVSDLCTVDHTHNC